MAATRASRRWDGSAGSPHARRQPTFGQAAGAAAGRQPGKRHCQSMPTKSNLERRAPSPALTLCARLWGLPAGCCLLHRRQPALQLDKAASHAPLQQLQSVLQGGRGDPGTGGLSLGTSPVGNTFQNSRRVRPPARTSVRCRRVGVGSLCSSVPYQPASFLAAVAPADQQPGNHSTQVTGRVTHTLRRCLPHGAAPSVHSEPTCLVQQRGHRIHLLFQATQHLTQPLGRANTGRTWCEVAHGSTRRQGPGAQRSPTSTT